MHVQMEPKTKIRSGPIELFDFLKLSDFTVI